MTAIGHRRARYPSFSGSESTMTVGGGRPGRTHNLWCSGLPLLMDGARISTNPPDDVELASRVRELVSKAEAPENLEDLLRPEYPNVRVVRGVTDVVDRWYVYREGRWIRS